MLKPQSKLWLFLSQIPAYLPTDGQHPKQAPSKISKMDILKPLTSRLTAHPKLLVSAIAIATPIAYLSYLHHSLSTTTSHHRSSGPRTREAVADISSVPASVLEGGYKMVRDHAWKRVRKEKIPAGLGGRRC
ncbi:hypothetical protein VC83_02792 [Pseudogymnoascus destructans]|uniref:Uncharacterized protein n=1 Tax=Pseudogymnoascus destructans TaxID=655981 RepID=A0A177ACU2_9PEZI|nr:uncharacterized protein VC83_02792 [Pseudogymnoascus destructans]OAF59926.1 hypothetical protein VC83_02792 [Pseudogymnoascus destructans]